MLLQVILPRKPFVLSSLIATFEWTTIGFERRVVLAYLVSVEFIWSGERFGAIADAAHVALGSERNEDA